MKKLALLIFSIAVAIASPSILAKQEEVAWSKQGKVVTANVNWCLNHRKPKTLKCVEAAKLEDEGVRVTEADTVQVKVTGFNFVNYGLELSVDETKIESYVYLNNLWGQLLGSSTLDLITDFATARTATRDGEQSDPIVDWWREIDLRSSELTVVAHKYSSQSFLGENELKHLNRKRAELVRHASTISSLKKKARDSVKSAKAIVSYNKINKLNDILLGQISNFAQLVDKSTNGFSTSIKRKEAGTFVDVKIQATSIEGGVKADHTSFGYLSESKLPLMFHGGLTYSQLRDTEFQTLRSITGQDLFTQVKDEDTSYSLAVYLSYPLSKASSGTDPRYYISLGTDIDEVGENLYLGLTGRVRDKWLVSAGVAYGPQTVGENAMNDSPSSNVFELIKEEREAEFFISVSYQMF